MDIEREPNVDNGEHRAIAEPNTILLGLVGSTVHGVTVDNACDLRSNKHWFAARRAGRAYLGYMERQRDRMTGERGQMRVNRPELIKQYGFDTKYAGHVLRLGYQGIEFLETGSLTLPLPEPQRRRVLDVRNGRVKFSDVLAEADELHDRLGALLQTSALPEHPDHDAVNAFLADTYRTWWAARDAAS